MIRYRLGCRNGHEFESWFRAGADFDAQQAAGQLACPQCADTEIQKLPMAPALVGRGSREVAQRPTATGTEAAPALIERIRAFKTAVMANSEDVGSRFAEEARRMHYGEAPERSIRGATSAEDARDLIDEGIPFGVLPTLPDEHN